MQFQVPQFIDVEDKIFGPLTFKQFIYILGGAGGTYVIYKIIPNTYLALLAASPVIIFALALSFQQVNGRPFIVMLEAGFRYLIAHKLYLWKKSAPKAKPDGTIEATTEQAPVFNPKLVSSKLKDLTWSLDVHEKIDK
ncbi:MAG: PrgI family protein [Candidatus Vogelbacteria bacterium]|nr:PrgI family protein [Candidatus Vogelbacteria bacterium]